MHNTLGDAQYYKFKLKATSVLVLKKLLKFVHQHESGKAEFCGNELSSVAEVRTQLMFVIS